MLEYFPEATADCPTFLADTEWHPLLDGEAYFARLDELIADLGPDDAVLISSLVVDSSLDFNGRRPGEAGYLALGERLARAAAAGATVRVLIAGRVLPSSSPWALLGAFRPNALHARRLRGWRPAGSHTAPLDDRVLIDFTGSLLGVNHQKIVVVSRGGELTAFVGGIDLEHQRFDAEPHERLRHRNRRWGWHDAVTQLRGPGAERVWNIVAQRWAEAATLPNKHFVRRLPRWEQLNPGVIAPVPPPPRQVPLDRPDTAVRILRSVPRTKFDSLLPWRRIGWDTLPATGVHEVFETVCAAIRAAHRYVYIEDQYLGESVGGDRRFELYPALRDAARRGVKVILVGSGIRDPDDPGFHVLPINRRLNRDLRRKIADRLDPEHRINLAVYRVEHLTVHAKLVLIDDTFACIGSANMFSRSMGGIDSEVSAAVTSTTPLVRDLRMRTWAEHLRTPVHESFGDLNLALGMWDERWLPAGHPPTSWREPSQPPNFAPTESVLRRVDG
ncbi:MAG TPA: phospholipase D-like domain-containing protein [Jatrophihabitans sp.]|nr:phospholipase D-like domain-containing protein [Jatrophihabitans sp.]